MISSSQYLMMAPSAFSIGDNTTALYHFGVLVDPLSEVAQKWSSLFEVRCSVHI